MAKTKVTFKTVRISDNDWKILADYPDHEQRQITGVTSKADADDWINGDRKSAWLRSQGYAKCCRPSDLDSSAVAVARVASAPPRAGIVQQQDIRFASLALSRSQLIV